MKIIQQTNSSLGKLGNTGNIVEIAALEAKKNDILLKVICAEDKFSTLPTQYTQAVMPFFGNLTMIVNGLTKYSPLKINGYKLRNELFDILSIRLIEQCDIFHSWSLSKRAFQKAKLAGAKTILDVEMDIWHSNSLSAVDYVCVPSPLLFRKALSLGFAKKSVFYHPFGVDTDFFVQKSRTNKGKFKAVFSGILAERKGMRELLEAWKLANIDDGELILCGHPTPFFKKVFSEIRPRGIKGMGKIDWAALRDTYQGADIMIFPSRKEGSAKAIYEALACGLPVITTYESGSIVTDGIEGFIVGIDDVVGIASRIKQFASDPVLLRTMGAAGRSKAETNTWKDYAQRTLEIYSAVYNGKPSEMGLDHNSVHPAQAAIGVR